MNDDMTLVVSDLQRTQNGNRLETSVAVRMGDDRHRLSLFHGGDFGPLENSAPEFDSFVTLLLIPAMARDMRIVVEGSVQAQRLDGMRRGLQTLLSAVNPEWRHVPIDADARTEAHCTDPSKGTAMGMSCGIDSLYAFMDMQRPEVAEDLRVKLLLHNDVGAHTDKKTFQHHRDTAQRFASEAGLPFISIECDLKRYYGKRFIHSHPLRNAGAAMTVEPLFHRFLYPKANDNVFPKPFDRETGLDAMELSILPQLDTNTHAYLCHGAQMQRISKTKLVMSEPLAHRYLTVCTREYDEQRGKPNCGRCMKCARALFYADANGVLAHFSETFDIEAFQRNKRHALLRLLRYSVLDRKGEEEREALAYLFEQNYDMPLWFKPFRKAVGVSDVDKNTAPYRPAPASFQNSENP